MAVCISRTYQGKNTNVYPDKTSNFIDWLTSINDHIINPVSQQRVFKIP